MTFLNQILPLLFSFLCLLKPTHLEKMWFKIILLSVLVVACPLLSTCLRFRGEDRIAPDPESHLRTDRMTTMTGEGQDGPRYDPLLSCAACASMLEETVSVDEYRDGTCGGFDNEVSASDNYPDRFFEYSFKLISSHKLYKILLQIILSLIR